MTSPRLSVIIVTYNSRQHIDDCLESLSPDRVAVDHEVVVVDNASRDGTAEAVRRRWPGVRVIGAGRNVGFAAANNIGFRHTVGELVLLLNPDTVVPETAIDTMVSLLDARPEVSVVGPRLVDRRGRSELSFGRMMSPWTELWQKLLVRGHDRQIPLASAYVEHLARMPKTVDWVSGACLLVRRRDAEAVGFLDEQFFMYAEDVDFCAAVRARGGAVWFTPEVHVVHLRGKSSVSSAEARAAHRRSRLAFYSKHHPRWLPLLRAYLKIGSR